MYGLKTSWRPRQIFAIECLFYQSITTTIVQDFFIFQNTGTHMILIKLKTRKYEALVFWLLTKQNECTMYSVGLYLNTPPTMTILCAVITWWPKDHQASRLRLTLGKEVHTSAHTRLLGPCWVRSRHRSVRMIYFSHCRPALHSVTISTIIPHCLTYTQAPIGTLSVFCKQSVRWRNVGLNYTLAYGHIAQNGHPPSTSQLTRWLSYPGSPPASPFKQANYRGKTTPS